jgi:nucleotide-binding universal stress UspA family protein
MAATTETSVLPDLHIKKIAVLTDFSENAADALQCAVAIARRYHAAIVLAHAYIPLSCAYAAPEPNLVYQTLESERRELKAQLLSSLRESFLSGMASSVFLMRGAPRNLLKKLSDVDLVVVGTSGETGLEKVALGSTAETVFRCSLVPVLTVGPHVQGKSREDNVIKTVLYATDFSARAAAALPYAVSIAKEHMAELVLFHATDDKRVPLSPDRGNAVIEPLKRLQGLIVQSAGLTRLTRCVVEFGRPSTAILQQARKLKAGMIVIGARQVDEFAELISHSGGGTAYRVAAMAECPVLVVPQI